MSDVMLPDWQEELDAAVRARFRECVGADVSVAIDAGEQAQLALDLLAIARRAREAVEAA